MDYVLSLHDALPISACRRQPRGDGPRRAQDARRAPLRLHQSEEGALAAHLARVAVHRSEEHTSELQSLRHLVCRLLLEKKKDKEVHDTGTQHATTA